MTAFKHLILKIMTKYKAISRSDLYTKQTLLYSEKKNRRCVEVSKKLFTITVDFSNFVSNQCLTLPSCSVRFYFVSFSIAPLGKRERKTATFSKTPILQIFLEIVLNYEHFQNVHVSFVVETVPSPLVNPVIMNFEGYSSAP